MDTLSYQEAHTYATSYARRMARTRIRVKDFDDYYQDAMVRFLRAGNGSFKVSRNDFAIKVELRHVRRRPKIAEPSPRDFSIEPTVPVWDFGFMELEAMDLVQEAKSKLAAMDQVILDCLVQGMEIDEITKLVGRKKSTVYSSMQVIRTVFQSLGGQT